MPAYDLFHQAVRNALIKDGWTITDDPLVLRFGSFSLYVDLGAEKLLAAEREGKKIAVEIKSFAGSSTINEFHTALGQFLTYRKALGAKEPSRYLFLAVPKDIFDDFFSTPLIQTVVAEYQVSLLVYRPESEEIVLWKS